MAESGRIYFSQIETDEQGNIWLIQNLDYESVILDLENTSKGKVILEDYSMYAYGDFYDSGYYEDEEGEYL